MFSFIFHYGATQFMLSKTISSIYQDRLGTNTSGRAEKREMGFSAGVNQRALQTGGIALAGQRPATGKKTAPFCPFSFENDHFAKTGSGQT